MRNLLVIGAIFIAAPVFATEGVSYKELWNELTKDVYSGALPQRKIYSDNIETQANRTLTESYDLHETPLKVKQAHPNGICLGGTWKISETTQYSGAFATGAEMLFVGRASTAMNNTKFKKGSTRAFGFAGKVFPTTDENQVVKTGNFFTADNLGGIEEQYFINASMTNNPPVSITKEVWSNISYAQALKKIFSRLDAPEGIRQLYQLSTILDDEKAITPKYIRITGSQNQKVTKADFRDELDLNQRDDSALVFSIEVGEDVAYSRKKTALEYVQVWKYDPTQKNVTDAKKVFKKVGEIVLDRSVRSASCDLKLHFAHPKFSKTVIHGKASKF